MTSKKFFFVLCAALVLLAAAGIAGTYFGASYLETRASNIVELKLQSAELDDQKLSLLQAKKDIQKYEELEHIAKSIVPQEKDQARTVREIVKIAEESNVPIGSITFPASTLGQAAPARRGTAPAAGEGSTATPQTSPTSSDTQVKPVEGIPGLYQLEINIQTVSSSPVRYTDMLNFLTKLQQNRRTSHVTNLTVTPSRDNRNAVVFSLTVNAYIKP